MIPDIANIVAGAYKGFMNAQGTDVDPTYLAFTLAATSILSCHARYKKEKKEDKLLQNAPATVYRKIKKNPITEAAGVGLTAIPIGAIEIICGYGLGYVAATKLFS